MTREIHQIRVQQQFEAPFSLKLINNRPFFKKFFLQLLALILNLNFNQKEKAFKLLRFILLIGFFLKACMNKGIRTVTVI